MKKEKVYTFQDFDDVVSFVHDLKGTFNLTPFEFVLPYLENEDGADIFAEVEFTYSLGNGGCIIKLTFHVSDQKVLNFDFRWETSSEHIVQIALEVGKYNLYLGADKSENFYMTIARMLGLIKEEILGNTPKNEKVSRQSFRNVSWLIVHPPKENGFYSIVEDTPEELERLTTAQREA